MSKLDFHPGCANCRAEAARAPSGDPSSPPQHVISAWAKDCRNCLECGSRPCDACMAGGVCDRMCTCDEGDPEERDYDPDEDRTP